MKTLFTLLLFSLGTITASAQCGTLTSHGVVPNPTLSNDSAWLNLQTYCGYNIWLDHYTVTPSGNSFMVEAYYCQGMLTVVTTTNDSIPLGILAAGSYSYIVNVYTSGDCITYTTTDQDGGNFTVSNPTGVNEASENSIEIFPNPFDETISVRIPAGISSCTVEISDAGGKLIYTEKNITGSSHQINTKMLASGVYIVEIISDEKRYFQKMVK